MEDISGWRAVRQWHSSASGWTDKTVVWKSSGGGEAIEAAFVLKEDSVLLFSISSSAPSSSSYRIRQGSSSSLVFFICLSVSAGFFSLLSQKMTAKIVKTSAAAAPMTR